MTRDRPKRNINQIQNKQTERAKKQLISCDRTLEDSPYLEDLARFKVHCSKVKISDLTDNEKKTIKIEAKKRNKIKIKKN